MISSLIEGVLLIALVVTGGMVAVMYRELKRQGDYRREYADILRETSRAIDGMDRTVRDLRSHGSQLVGELNERIGEARQIASDIETLVRNEKKSDRPGAAETR